MYVSHRVWIKTFYRCFTFLRFQFINICHVLCHVYVQTPGPCMLAPEKMHLLLILRAWSVREEGKGEDSKERMAIK